ncbi:MAG: MFS transporter, partial [Candidatus Nitrosotenuis sp.]
KEDVAKDMGLWQSSIAAPQIFSGASGRLLDYGNSIQNGLGYIITFSMASIAFFLGTILVRKIKGSS